MKKILTILLMCVSLGLYAQLGGDGKPKWEQKAFFPHPVKGSYVSLLIGYTTVENSPTGIVGLKFATVVNHWLSAGIMGNFMLSRPLNSNDIYYDYVNYMGGYGGFFMAISVYPKGRIHITTPISTGVGWLGQYNIKDNTAYYNFSEVYYAYIEGGAELEFNLTTKLRMAFGANYVLRYDLSEVSNINSGMIDNINLNLQFKWGIF